MAKPDPTDKWLDDLIRCKTPVEILLQRGVRGENQKGSRRWISYTGILTLSPE
jgi:hypothetical protein